MAEHLRFDEGSGGDDDRSAERGDTGSDYSADDNN